MSMATDADIQAGFAEALEPLKDLRGLVAAETASSISALSGRMKSVLDRIQFRERLSFEDAALSKKSVQVSGSFDHGIRIDASTVAAIRRAAPRRSMPRRAFTSAFTSCTTSSSMPMKSVLTITT